MMEFDVALARLVVVTLLFGMALTVAAYGMWNHQPLTTVAGIGFCILLGIIADHLHTAVHERYNIRP